MTKRALDLYCGAGGSAMGLYLAGYEVFGVDSADQPRYPFDFKRGDALDIDLDGYDLIWASPPCQAHSALKTMHPDIERVDLIPQTRERLVASGIPYVIENVPGAPLIDPVKLCGSMFNLSTLMPNGERIHLRCHRLFESNVPLAAPGPCSCHGKKTIGVYGHGDGGGRNPVRRGWKGTHQLRKAVMGIHWMNRHELAQAIPPAYAKWIGEQAP